jgi:hypothetical protein
MDPLTSQDIIKVKAAIWAFGHIGTSVGGLKLLLFNNVIYELVNMVEKSPILSIRGTCFYSLCLISKTPQGADSLLSMGWTSVRHSREEKWPLRFEETVKEIIQPSSPLSPSSITPNALFNDTMSSPLSLRSKSNPSLDIPVFDKDDSKKSARSPGMLTKGLSSNSFIARNNYTWRAVKPLTLTDKVSFGSVPDSPIRSGISRHGSVGSIRIGGVSGFMGVALPLELSSVFTIEDNFEGSRALVVTTRIFDDDHHFLLDQQDHQSGYGRAESSPQPVDVADDNQVTSTNGASSMTLNKQDADNEQQQQIQQQNEDEKKKDEKILATSVVSRTSVSSSTSGSVVFDEQSPEGRLLLHREFLEVIYYLCSDVSLKKNTLHLNILCSKFPILSQDISLYWKTMKLLSTYNYSLTIRRLIQSKFENLTFDDIFSYTRQYYQTRERLRSDSETGSRRKEAKGKIIREDDEAKLEETLDTQSMVTTTTTSELDTLSEGSIDSNEVLNWENEESTDTTKTDKEELGNIAESGNRLSQLDYPTGNSNIPVSVVEVLYDM